MSADNTGVGEGPSPEQLEQMMNDFDARLDQAREKKQSLAEAMGVTDEQIEAMYSMAYVAYQGRKYLDAQFLFSNLIMLKPSDPRFAFGMASCLKVQGNFDQALLMFGLAMGLEPQSARPVFFGAECAWMTGDKDGTVTLLEEAVKRAKSDEESAKYGKRAEVMLQTIADGATPPNPEVSERLAEMARAAHGRDARPAAEKPAEPAPEPLVPPGKAGGRRRFRV